MSEFTIFRNSIRIGRIQTTLILTDSFKNPCPIRPICVLLFSLLLSSCSITKHLPEGESLYKGAEIKIVADSSITKKQAKAIEAQLEPLVRPRPNSQLLGYPYKVGFYYLFGTPKRTKGFRVWFRNRFGEPPVLASKRAVTTSSNILTNFLQNEGYFQSSATGELIETGRTSKAHYTVRLRQRYLINEVAFVTRDSSRFSKDFSQTQTNSLLKKGNPYRFSVIEAERVRIDQALKRRGFYYFRPDYLIVKADTNLGNHRLNLYVELKPNTTQLALKKYYIKDVFVISQEGTLKRDTLSDAVMHRRIHIVDPSQGYKKNMFADAVGFRPGMAYSSDQQEVSVSRLINLKNFRFVRNRFELLPRSDSALLNVFYYLTPMKRKSLRAELSAVTKSNNLAGSQVNLTWLHRNLFKGAEQLRLNANAGLDLQVGGQRNTNINDFYRLNVQGDLTFPRFVLPFYRINPSRNQTLPQTNLTIGLEQLTQRTLYTQTSIRLNWGYVWRRNTQVEHSLAPIALNIVRPTNITENFVNKIFTSTQPQDLLRYFSILENRLILGAQYNINYTPTPRPLSNHRFVLTGGLDIAGNLAGLFAKRTEEGSGLLFGIPYEQYARFDGDFRYYNTLNPSLRWANRLLVGVGIPYGNSLSLPQFKQYFGGGSTGIRAFRARALGPGSYRADTTSLAIFGNASFGDIRLETSTELRYKLNDYVELASFVDAGNIWMYRNFEDSFYLPEDNAVFTREFYKQVAVGGGLGLRITTPFLVLRLDLATPFRKPWLPEGERWVLGDFRFRDKAWRRENAVLNIAVGYSF